MPVRPDVVTRVSGWWEGLVTRPPLGPVRAAAWAVLALSLAVHVLSFVPPVSVSMGWAWPLHLATVAVWTGAFVLFLVPRLTRGARPAGVGSFAGWRREDLEWRGFHRRVLRILTWPVRVLVVAAFPYAFLAYILCVGALDGGLPQVVNGRHTLSSHGTVIRLVSPAEYRRLQAYEVRLFSAGWVAFAVIGTAFLQYAAPRLDEILPERAAGPPPLPS